MKLPRPRSGFTLIELLIVVAIIGILAALVSSAIMKLTKTAANKRNVNNAERLEAAIVEYWHDMGRWPIPKKGLTITPGKGTGLAGSSDEGKDVDTYSYTTAFKANNNEIVEKLINATLPDGTQKTFLDLHGFSTPIDASGDGPYEDVVDAYLAYTGDARKPDGSTFTQKKPTLVYFAPFLECPKCPALYPAPGSRTFCDNTKGEGHNGNRYRFTKSEKAHPVSKAMPFVIEFDLFSNVVKVRAP